jgi:hypothetical protein
MALEPLNIGSDGRDLVHIEGRRSIPGRPFLRQREKRLETV